MKRLFLFFNSGLRLAFEMMVLFFSVNKKLRVIRDNSQSNR